MKARELTRILNDTKYIVADHGEYIAVGSPLCHDLIKVDKKTKKLSYALDTWREGRKALERDKDELLFIWDTLQNLISTGKIDDIMSGIDELENPLPVFTVEDGELIETTCEAYGWPNVTKEGWPMHNNDYFPTREKAIEYGIESLGYWLEGLRERRSDLAAELQKITDRIELDIKKREELIKLREK